MHHAGLKKRWKYQVTTRMKKAHREGQWRFPKSKGFPMIRYAGLFSDRWKEQYLGRARSALNQSEPHDSSTRNLPSSWAERQTDYTGIDPLLCPHCDKPQPLLAVSLETGTNSSHFLISQAKTPPFLPLYCDRDNNHVDTIQKDPLQMYILWSGTAYSLRGVGSPLRAGGHDAVFCGLNAFSKSKRDSPLSGSAMIAMPARHRSRSGKAGGSFVPVSLRCLKRRER